MRGWQCYLCKKWKEPKQATYKDNQGKLCENCHNDQKIRQQAQEEAKEKNQDKSDDDWDLGTSKKSCSLNKMPDDDCDSCQ